MHGVSPKEDCFPNSSVLSESMDRVCGPFFACAQEIGPQKRSLGHERLLSFQHNGLGSHICLRSSLRLFGTPRRLPGWPATSFRNFFGSVRVCPCGKQALSHSWITHAFFGKGSWGKQSLASPWSQDENGPSAWCLGLSEPSTQRFLFGFFFKEIGSRACLAGAHCGDPSWSSRHLPGGVTR